MKLRSLSVTLLVILAAILAQAANRNTWPLPEDRGVAGTLTALEKLPVYTRVLFATAHPDDEAAGTLVWLTRHKHARTALFSLTRGEGGQNILGREQYEAMGILRTGELLEACKYYGVELFFSTAFDFGFSKNAEEALAKWGREETLGEMVRFIRIWRPTIIISRFRGDSTDGHGHHQAAGIITHEAFRAAGDPSRFPEQLQVGLQPWQAKKLYLGATRPGPPARADESGWTVRVPVGDYDPVLGRSYREIGSEGYSKHRSQGNGAGSATPGRSLDAYKLQDSTVGMKDKEENFFDSVDTSLLAILELAGKDAAGISFLREDLTAAQKLGEDAISQYEIRQPRASAEKAAQGVTILKQAIARITESQLPASTKEVLLDALRQKSNDFQEAVNALLGIYLIVRAEDATIVPAQDQTLTVNFYDRGPEAVDFIGIEVLGHAASKPIESKPGTIGSGETQTHKFSISFPAAEEPTELPWYRTKITDARYKVKPGWKPFIPFPDPEVSVRATYRYQGSEISIQEPARASAGDPIRGADFVSLQVVPPLSVSLTPGSGIAPISDHEITRDFQVSVLNNLGSGTHGTLKVSATAGWRVEPPEMPFSLSRKGESFTATFTLHIPAGISPGKYTLEATASADGKEFRSGYRTVSYPENWTRNIYSPARAEVALIDVKMSSQLSVGYIMGAGDEVPAALEQLGIKAKMLSSEDLAFGDLSRFSVIVTGIRAYNVNEDLQANNQRLLKYVEQGGVLIVQYNTPGRGGPATRDEGSPFAFAPYPMTTSTADRITVEESPVKILAPENPVFTRPNKITAEDFQGWIQERGLYFARKWDSHYTPLLSSNDPGEEPLAGGMLVATYGKGYYVYTAYSWFRQLPAGVPGAFRIFANLLSLGR